MYSISNGSNRSVDYFSPSAELATKFKGSLGKIMNPLLDMPLSNSFAMKTGIGEVNFTRDSSATYINRYGDLQSVAKNEPRFENDGLLIENSSSNLITYSQDFTNDNFYEVKECNIEQDIANIDGSTEACKLVPTTAEDSHTYGKKQISFDKNAKVTISITAEYAGVQYLSIQHGNFVSWETRGSVTFDLINGKVVYEETGAGNSIVTGHISDLGKGRFRCELRGGVRNDEDKVSTVYLQPRIIATASKYVGDDAAGIIIHNMQGEYLSFATSYIPTTDETVTRATEKCIVSGNNVPYQDFTILMSSNSFGTDGTDRAKTLSMMSSDGNDKLTCGYSYNHQGQLYVDDDTMASIYFGDILNHSSTVHWAFRFCKGIVDVYVEGQHLLTVDKGLTDTYDAGSYLSLGGADTDTDTGCLFGHLKSLKIYDFALDDEEIKLLQ